MFLDASAAGVLAATATHGASAPPGPTREEAVHVSVGVRVATPGFHQLGITLLALARCELADVARAIDLLVRLPRTLAPQRPRAIFAILSHFLFLVRALAHVATLEQTQRAVARAAAHLRLRDERPLTRVLPGAACHVALAPIRPIRELAIDRRPGPRLAGTRLVEDAAADHPVEGRELQDLPAVECLLEIRGARRPAAPLGKLAVLG
mmetsp:Transcript_11410/g.40488  ORF Transcript_11410/g.40488 Transcript_11410/m.40488 type:complete len:208 (+) Transcript_11410:1851-2474(+)